MAGLGGAGWRAGIAWPIAGAMPANPAADIDIRDLVPASVVACEGVFAVRLRKKKLRETDVHSEGYGKWLCDMSGLWPRGCKRTFCIRPNPAAKIAIGASHKRSFIDRPATSARHEKRTIRILPATLILK